MSDQVITVRCGIFLAAQSLFKMDVRSVHYGEVSDFFESSMVRLDPNTPAQDWACCFAHSPCRISLPRQPCRVGLRIVLFEVCSAFATASYGLHTRAVTVYRDTLSEGFTHFVTSMTAPVASGWSVRRVEFAPTGKRQKRLVTAHGAKRT